MAFLQTAWQTIVDRIRYDSDVGDNFDNADYSDMDQNWTGNYLNYKIGIRSIPKAIEKRKQTEMLLNFTIISGSGDPEFSEKQALKSLEIFMNIFEKNQTEAEWLASFVKSDWETEPSEILNDGKQVKINGVVTLMTQPYTMGAL